MAKNNQKIMHTTIKSRLVLGMLLISFFACNRGPKVIKASNTPETAQTPHKNSGIFSAASTTPSEGLMPSIPPVAQTANSEFHSVIVDEVLPTNRYVYLHVHEGNEKFWIATRKQEIQKGGTYYYRDGLLKTNFESKEYNRIFDKIYLVSKLVGQNHAGNAGQLSHNHEAAPHNHAAHTASTSQPLPTPKGSVLIAKLVASPEKYKGQTIQITGKCVKVNPNIMNRHWLHLQDGTKDDFDLVVTTNEVIREGEIVTMRATVGMDVDFGAGYKYDLILENGVLVK